MTSPLTPGSIQVTGRVKWYSISKGYGFIHTEDLERDVFIQSRVLQEFGLDYLEDSARIVMFVKKTSKGYMAMKILEIESSNKKPEIPESDWIRAKVKWYDMSKGFGFLETQGLTKDIWIHENTLYSASITRLSEGEYVEVRYHTGDRGLVADEVRYPT